MRPWVIWMINHRMSFIVKLLVVFSFPIQLLNYSDEAWSDIVYVLESIDEEKE